MVNQVSSTFVNTLERFGFLDILLPFILIFTITFAVMNRLSVFGTAGAERRKYATLISLVVSLVVVVPHVRGSYPFGFDPIDAINAALPSVSLVLVAAVMLLMVMGVFGTTFAAAIAPFIGVLSVIFIVYIFGASIGFWRSPSDIFRFWNPEITSLIIIIVVFIVIVIFITREPGDKSAGEGAIKAFGKLFERI